MATREADLAAVFAFYGTGPGDPAAYATIAAPVFGFYGGNDQRVNASLEATAAARQRFGKAFKPVTYEEAGHAFMRSGDGPAATGPNRVARDAAFARLVQAFTP